MSATIPLFQLNPALDRAALATAFARHRRIQIRDVLTRETAATVHDVLARATPWGFAIRDAARETHLGPAEQAALTPPAKAELGRNVAAVVRDRGYGFAYQRYPMLTAYLERRDPDGPLALLVEHLNDAPLLELVRAVTGDDAIVKADAQATLFAPGQFLGLHDDGRTDESGRRIAYVLNFTRDWHEDWGGYLLFYDADGDVVAGFRPRWNALNLFAVPQRHNVTYVPPWSPVGRFAITGWFRDR